MTVGNIILVKYFDHDGYKVPELHKESIGYWIDLYAAERIHLEQGEFKLIPLGVGMRIPIGCEAHLAPRSSTFINWGIIQTNSIGIIDNSYSGDNDEWKMPVYATRPVTIKPGDKIAQFRIFDNQSSCSFETVEHLERDSRGGFGSTGSR